VRRSKAKLLGGAPKGGGRWKPVKPDRPVPRERRGTVTLLLVVALALLGGVGGFAVQMHRQLEGGLVRQWAEARRRDDWVPVRALPAYVPAAFLAVVDTTSMLRQPQFTPARDPQLAADLVRQVHLLGPGPGDQAKAVALTPLLQQRFSHDALLELFLNRIELGRTGRWQVYGVGHAARDYFGKDARQLTVSEAATLAGLLLAPRVTDPEGRPGAVGPRRNEVLRRLLAAGTIDAAAYRAAIAEPLAFQPGVDYAPMTRPADWKAPARVIRLPEPDSASSPDSARANPDGAAPEGA
jgi:membrane peptidoglycan carboxypeptidase